MLMLSNTCEYRIFKSIGINSASCSYDRSEISQGSTLSSPTSWTVEDIETWLLALTASVNNGQPLLAAVDIFEQGLDR